MDKYRAVFNGRAVGAIGITDTVDVIVEANSLEEAHLKLYDKYEHILGLCLVNQRTKEAL